jgi:hypothetical protein
MDRAPVVRTATRPGQRVSGLSVVFFAVAVAFIVIGFVYFTRTSVQLPSFLPGHYERSHAAGHVAEAHKHHIKLGLLAFGLAALSLIEAGWYADAPDV